MGFERDEREVGWDCWVDWVGCGWGSKRDEKRRDRDNGENHLSQVSKT